MITTDLYEPLNNNSPLGSVTIDGDVIQGSTLLANTSTLDDEDGLGALSYQWFAMERVLGQHRIHSNPK